MTLLTILAACGTPVETKPVGPSAEPVADPSDPSEPGETGEAEEPGEVGGESCTPAATVVLNEVCPSNVSVLRDVAGDTVDWVELTNTGEQAVDLGGWSLSDDPEEGPKWTFPSVVLEPGGFLVVYASDATDRTLVVGTWDTRIDQGDLWRYLPVASLPDPAWSLSEYDDSGWAVGPSGFGFGDLDDATEVTTHTIYARTDVTLTADELGDLAALYLHVDYDDAIVAYLNGTEVARTGLWSAGPPAWDALADYDHEAQLYVGESPEFFDLGPSMSLLSAGTNTLAVEVHNRTATGTDLSLVPFLSLGFGSERPARTSTALELPLAQLHASFALQAEGEPIRLYDPAGCEVSGLDPGPMTGDQSFGRQPDGAGSAGYFLEPTPGAPNATEMRPGFAAVPTFDPPPGWYDGGTDVTIGGAPGATTRYTWEGFEPTEADAVYSDPLSTGVEGDAVILRARTWE
nr:lamin tail domain-containing protein [Deltaproteobacteria bacterium]